MDVAAFLVVMDKGLHEETIEGTIAAVRQLRGVAGIRTIYDDVGTEITLVRKILDDTRGEVLDRVRKAGGA